MLKSILVLRRSKEPENRTFMIKQITSILDEAIATKTAVRDDARLLQLLKRSSTQLAQTIKQGGTVYACGNGGSTCDAMHLCEELVAKYKRDRPGIKAMHFMDPSTATCWGNDIGFDDVFARHVETFCTPKDVLIAISTSGNSANVVRAIHAAKKKKTKIIGLLGKGGGKIAPLCDTALIVPSGSTERIQELHITFIHIWCEILETSLAATWQCKKSTTSKKSK
jgi:D-sedoheptulose 7-phosphate isomerase